MTPRIAILDYGMGNLRSVEKALERVGAEAAITSDPDTARQADGLILPGVGAFPKAMERVNQLRLDQLIADRLDAGTHLLVHLRHLQFVVEIGYRAQRSDQHLGADSFRVVH